MAKVHAATRSTSWKSAGIEGPEATALRRPAGPAGPAQGTWSLPSWIPYSSGLSEGVLGAQGVKGGGAGAWAWLPGRLGSVSPVFLSPGEMDIATNMKAGSLNSEKDANVAG